MKCILNLDPTARKSIAKIVMADESKMSEVPRESNLSDHQSDLSP